MLACITSRMKKKISLQKFGGACEKETEIRKTYVLSVHLFKCIQLFISTVRDLIWVLIIPYLDSLYMEWDK